MLPQRLRHRVGALHVPAEVAAERITPTSGAVEAIDDGSCLLHAGSSSLGEMAVWSALIGSDLDVLDPPEPAEVIGSLAARLGQVELLLS